MDALPVRLRSVATAAHLSLATGITPTAMKRHDGVVVFEFPPSAEPALRLFLTEKLRFEQLAKEAA